MERHPSLIGSPIAVAWIGLALVFLATAAQSARADPVWDGASLPITIEVKQDVPVGLRYCGIYFQRATLCSDGDFTIRKGQRFRMVEVLQEGGCRFEFVGSPHESPSCPWLPGSLDSQGDIYVIVEFQNR